MKVIEINKDLLNAWDLSSVIKYTEWNEKNAQYFNLEAGKEHYRVLGYIADQVDSPVCIDIGTYYGFSALALASSGKSVITYDVCDWIPDEDVEALTSKTHKNIKGKIMNCEYDMEEIIKSDFVVLDVDPHDGIQEVEILGVLEKSGFKGIVLLDDIHLNDAMKQFWNSIKQKKIDITQYGHWSGSGLVIFDPERYEIVLS